MKTNEQDETEPPEPSRSASPQPSCCSPPAAPGPRPGGIDGLIGSVLGARTSGLVFFTAKAGEVSTPDGGSIHFWGYQGGLQPEGGLPAGALPQYPGPTLILNRTTQ